MLLTALLTLMALPQPSVDASNLTPVFDGRVIQTPAKVQAVDVALLRKEVRGVARRLWAKRTDFTEFECSEQFDVRDVATGAFSRTGVNQKAFLYSYCNGGSWFARNGIVIVEDQQVIAHFVYDGTSGEHAILAVPDLDGDGLSEFLVVFGGTGQGQTTAVAELLGWSAKGIEKLGMLDAYEDDCGTGQTKTAFRILAQPGPKPSFFREEYAGTCEREGWRKTGPPLPLVPRPNDITYRLAPLPQSPPLP